MKSRKLHRLLILLLLGLVFLSQACGPGALPGEEGLDQVVLALDWTPNTNHAGLFLARDRGYFEEEAIALDLRESDMNFIEMVAGGTAAFGLASQEQVLQARASEAGLPIVAVAAVLQHNTSGFASPKDRGIVDPKGFEGRTYSGWGTELELAILKTLMEKEGADFDKVQVINQSAGNFIASMETEADFAWIYYGWDGIICEQESYPINFIPLQALEPDLDFYSPVIITNERTIEENPDLIKRFLRAAERGYLDAMADPEAAVGSLLEAAPELDGNLLLASQRYINDHYLQDAPWWGAMDHSTWEGFASWMDSHGLLDRPLELAGAYDTSFLPGEGG